MFARCPPRGTAAMACDTGGSPGSGGSWEASPLDGALVLGAALSDGAGDAASVLAGASASSPADVSVLGAALPSLGVGGPALCASGQCPPQAAAANAQQT